MIYKVVDLKAVKETGTVYVLVHFWDTRAAFQRGRPPVLENDFYMALQDKAVRLVVEEGGGEAYVTTQSGIRRRMSARLQEDPADPFVRETVKRDIPSEIDEAVVRYWRRAKARNDKGNRTWPEQTRPTLQETDPSGVLDRTDVKNLKGKDFEVSVSVSS